MAYSVTSTPVFNPFSYERYLQPYAENEKDFIDIEDKVGDLEVEASKWENKINKETDKKTAAQYQKYADDLRDSAEKLYKEGLTATSRRNLIGMKRRYSKEITPIEDAYNARAAANDFRAKAGPDAIFEVNSYNSLDDFLDGQIANNRYQSREALTKKTAALTEAAMAEALQDPDFRKYMNDQFWLVTQHTGGSYADLKAALANNAPAQNRFNEIKQRVMKDAGYDRYDAIGQQAIEDAINTGLYSGLDKPTQSLKENTDHITAYQRSNLALERDRLNLSAASSGMVYDPKEGKWKYDENADPAIAAIKARAASNGGDSSTWIPEVIDGKETGRYYNPKDKKFYNRDGTLAQQGVYKERTGSISAQPLFFDAWSKGASKGFQMKNYNDQDSGLDWWTDTSKINYSDLHGKEAKDVVRQYVYNISGLSTGDSIPESVVSDIAENLLITRDFDMFSDNHFAVRVPGVDDEGEIINKEAYDKAMTEISGKIAKWQYEVLTSTAPVSKEEQKSNEELEEQVMKQ